MFALIYYIIGILVAGINVSLFEKIQTQEQRKNELPSILICMFIWVIAWPVGLFHTYKLSCKLIRQHKQ